MDTLSAGLDDLARRHFGVPRLRPVQRVVVENIRTAYRGMCADPNSRDTSGPQEEVVYARQLVLVPTGGGKSLCFLLPSVFLRRPSLVVYPLLSLIRDQQRRMEEAGLPALSLTGGLSRSEIDKAFRRIAAGEVQFVLTNPEFLIRRVDHPGFRRLRFDHFVIDEAHCVSEWGDSFRPAYKELGRVAAALQIPLRTAFTATASSRIVEAIQSSVFTLDGSAAHLVTTIPDRPNIRYSVLPCVLPATAAFELIRGRMRGPHLGGNAIVFCRTRRETQSFAFEMAQMIPTVPVRHYHAGLSRPTKLSIERWYFRQKRAVLAATCAYGMGVDKPDIRTVIHTSPPSTVEAYLQESGRAGRDGDPAEAILLFPAESWARREALETALSGSHSTESDFPPPELQMLRYCTEPGCRRRFLMKLMDSEIEACSGCDSCDGDRVDRCSRESSRIFTSVATGLPLPRPARATITKEPIDSLRKVALELGFRSVRTPVPGLGLVRKIINGRITQRLPIV